MWLLLSRYALTSFGAAITCIIRGPGNLAGASARVMSPVPVHSTLSSPMPPPRNGHPRSASRATTVPSPAQFAQQLDDDEQQKSESLDETIVNTSDIDDASAKRHILIEAAGLGDDEGGSGHGGEGEEDDDGEEGEEEDYDDDYGNGRLRIGSHYSDYDEEMHLAAAAARKPPRSNEDYRPKEGSRIHQVLTLLFNDHREGKGGLLMETLETMCGDTGQTRKARSAVEHLRFVRGFVERVPATKNFILTKTGIELCVRLKLGSGSVKRKL